MSGHLRGHLAIVGATSTMVRGAYEWPGIANTADQPGILPRCADCAFWRPLGGKRESAGIGRCALTSGTMSADGRCASFDALRTSAPPPAPPSPQLPLF